MDVSGSILELGSFDLGMAGGEQVIVAHHQLTAHSYFVITHGVTADSKFRCFFLLQETDNKFQIDEIIDPETIAECLRQFAVDFVF